eukprot:gb/GFBE01000916.1/.p1 GENE.gb/GFBE01000916.1/~~gb/GFBE01000916.1/.p1  ORF type:complete len:127 (+),score=18.16 gb/GFBE01000916.1/:1-381(+)
MDAPKPNIHCRGCSGSRVTRTFLPRLGLPSGTSSKGAGPFSIPPTTPSLVTYASAWRVEADAGNADGCTAEGCEAKGCEDKGCAAAGCEADGCDGFLDSKPLNNELSIVVAGLAGWAGLRIEGFPT